MQQVLVIHLMHLGYNEIESASATGGHPNKLFQIKLLKEVANVEVVKVPRIAAKLSYNAQL